MIHFRNIESFNKLMNHLHSLSTEEIKEWLKENNFSNSLFLLEEKTDVDIPDPIFRIILNKNFMYSINDEIHKITNNEELYIRKSLIKNINQFDWNSRDVNRFEIIKRDKKISPKARKDTRKYEPYNGDFMIWDPYAGWNGEWKVYDINVTHLSAHIEAWNRTYLTYASAGLRIKGRKLDGGSWRDDTMWYASIDYECKGHMVIGGVPTVEEIRTGFKSGTNEKDVEKTIFWAAGIGAWIDIDYFNGDYGYEDDGYPRVYRFNEYFDF